MATISPRAMTGDPDAGRAVEPTSGVSRWQKMVGIAGLMAVLWAGNNIYEAIDRGSVGPGGGSPGGHAPSGGTDQQPPGGTDQQPPGGTDQQPPGGTGGQHDPSQFDHG